MVIPVELNLFTASVEDRSVLIVWTTATEINNRGFEIERKENEQAWNTIGFVSGNGTTTDPKYYSYEDKNLPSGKYFYRLKQIDYDGSFEYLNVIEVEVGWPSKFELHQNYPNPFNPNTKISWQSPVSSWQTLKVYDILGNEVETLVNEEKPSGSYEVEFNAKGLSSGIYLYKLTTGHLTSIRKMLLLR